MNPFFRNIVKLFSATLVSQAIALASSFVLAKWAYSPTQFGDFSVFLSFIGIFSVASTLRLDVLIVLPEQLAAAQQLFLLALRVVCSIFISSMGIILCLSVYKDIYFLYPYIGGIFAIWLIGLQNIGISMLTRQGNFGKIGISRLLLSAFTFFMQYILHFVWLENGLVVGYLLGMTISTIYLYSHIWVHIKADFHYDMALQVVKNYQNILRYGFPADILNTTALNIHPFLIHHFFGATTAGWYFFAQRILTVPMQIISASVSQVYFQRMASLYQTNKEKMLDETLRIVYFIGGIIGLFLLGTVFFSEPIIYAIFGEKWMGAVPFLLYLVPLVFVRSLVNPISSLAEVLNKTNIAFLFNVYYLLGNIIALYIGYLYADKVHWVALLSWVGAPAYMALLLFYLYELKKIQSSKSI